MSVHHQVGAADVSGHRGDNSSLNEIDQFFNDFQQQDGNGGNFNDGENKAGGRNMGSGGRGGGSGPNSSDDIGKLDLLLKKLIDSKKITKK